MKSLNGIELTETNRQIVEALVQCNGQYLDGHNNGRMKRLEHVVVFQKNNEQFLCPVPDTKIGFCLNPLLHVEDVNPALLSTCSVGGTITLNSIDTLAECCMAYNQGSGSGRVVDLISL